MATIQASFANAAEFFNNLLDRPIRLTQINTAFCNMGNSGIQARQGRALLRWVQIALKPAPKALGLRGVFKRGKGRQDLIADSAFKRV